MKKVVCLIAAAVLLATAYGCDKSDNQKILEEGFASFESEIRVVSKDVNNLFCKMFTDVPELQIYFGSLSVTTDGFEAVIDLEYENTSLPQESVVVGKADEALQQAIESTLAECKGQGAVVLLNQVEKPDPEGKIDEMRREDYLTVMGMESSRWVFSDNQFTEDMMVYYTFDYIDAPERIIEYRKEIKAEIERLSKELWKKEDGEQTRVRAIHDYLINHAQYNTSGQEDLLRDHTPYGVLLDGTGVCDSYTYAAHLLLNEAGIENHIAQGRSENTDHTWNVVKVDGQYYHLDITWDDPVSASGKEYIVYDYYLKSDETMKEDHIWEAELPACPEDYQ